MRITANSEAVMLCRTTVTLFHFQHGRCTVLESSKARFFCHDSEQFYISRTSDLAKNQGRVGELTE